MVKASDSKSDGVTRVGSNPAAVEFFILERVKWFRYFNKNKTLFDSTIYWYYSKDLNSKKSDNKGIRLNQSICVQDLQLMKETSYSEEQDE